jgi:DNA polymerase-3 subunit delta
LAPVAESELLPIYLLTGGDRPKIRRALERLRSHFGAESIETVSAESAGGDEAVASLNALGLFAGEGGRLVIVEEVERWKKADEEAVAGYVADPVHGAVLALVAGELKDSLLPALCAKAGKVLTFAAPRPRDLPAWVREQFERLGVRGDGDAARALVEIVGEDVNALATEVEKLAAWAGDDPVGRREVELLAAPAQEASAWAIMDAWGARDLPAALAACESGLERGDSDPFAVAVRVAAQVALVRQVQVLAEEGLGVKDIAKRLRKHEFRVRKALAHADNYTRDELDEAVVRLAALDASLKGASRLSGELELERAIVEIVRAPQPAHH